MISVHVWIVLAQHGHILMRGILNNLIETQMNPFAFDNFNLCNIFNKQAMNFSISEGFCEYYSNLF